MIFSVALNQHVSPLACNFLILTHHLLCMLHNLLCLLHLVPYTHPLSLLPLSTLLCLTGMFVLQDPSFYGIQYGMFDQSPLKLQSKDCLLLLFKPVTILVDHSTLHQTWPLILPSFPIMSDSMKYGPCIGYSERMFQFSYEMLDVYLSSLQWMVR